MEAAVGAIEGGVEENFDGRNFLVFSEMQNFAKFLVYRPYKIENFNNFESKWDEDTDINSAKNAMI